MKRLFLTVVLAAAGWCAYAQNYMIVDSEKIFKSIDAYNTAIKDLDKMAEDYQKQVDDKFAEIETLYNNYQQQKASLSATTRQVLEDTILSKEKDATALQESLFGKDGTLRDSHGRYVPAAAEVAAELNVPLVDMNRLTGELVLKYGPEESKKLYLYVEPNVAERFPDGNADDTHLCIRGAEEFAALFAEACAAANNPLGRYVKPNPAR